MSWSITKYERAVKAYFIKELGEDEGGNLYSDYENLRNALIKDNFFQEIKIKEPNLSDHSARHIKDVQTKTI